MPLPILLGQPGSGFDKSNRLSLYKVYVRTKRPYVAQDPNNPYCLYDLMQALRQMCEPTQERLFCKKKTRMTGGNNFRVNETKPYGPDLMQAKCKELAEQCDFLDYAMFAAHSNRRNQISNNVNNNAPVNE